MGIQKELKKGKKAYTKKNEGKATFGVRKDCLREVIRRKHG